MNKLTRRIVAILLILFVVSSAFAATTGEGLYQETATSPTAYQKVLDPINYSSARMMGMGGAGISGFYNADSLYINPASLANKGFVVNFPALSFTLYNLDILRKYNESWSSSMAKKTALNYIIDLSSSSGYNTLAEFDINASVKIKGFAAGVDLNASMLTYNENALLTDFEVYPKVDLVASLGYGHRFFKNRNINVDLGVAIRASIREYYNSIDYSSLINVLTAGNKLDTLRNLLNDNPAAIGFAFPIDLAANINFPYGFTLSGVVRNINGRRTFYYADHTKDLSFGYRGNGHSFSSNPTFNFGFGWTPDMGAFGFYIKPSILIDLVDVASVSSSNQIDNDKFLLSHTRIGAEIELFRFLKFRAGLSQGYLTFGAGFDILNCLHVDAAYYTQEFGSGLGTKPVDAVTIRISILHE